MSGKPNKNYYYEEHGTHEEHGGEESWLISYADLMTLLVGFFVILMSFSEMDQEKFEQAKKSITKEFGGKYETPYGDIADKIKASIEKTGMGGQVAIKTDEAGVEISFLGTTSMSRGVAGGVFDSLPTQDGLGFGTPASMRVVSAEKELLRVQRRGAEETIKRQLRLLVSNYNLDLEGMRCLLI